MNEEEFILNLDDREQKRRWLTTLGAMSGQWEIIMKPWKPRRSNQANRRYFGVIVKAFREFLAAQGESYSIDECHLLIKTKILGTRQIIDKISGEVIGELPEHSADKNSDEFSQFMQRAEIWLYDTFGIVCPQEPLAAEAA